jgi:hypothetical protein
MGVLGGILLLVILLLALPSSGGEKRFGSAVGGALLSPGELQRLKVNELGAIMVLEYHRLGEEGRWTRSPESFRRDLEILYENGYRCISVVDLATNNIDVEAGYTPVVITFDDADPSVFRFVEKDGELIIDPDCAVGIMEEFAREHPDFGMTATFYVLPTLFGQDEYTEMKLKYLVEHGYDIGNHTVNHYSLGEVDDATVVEEIVGNIKMVREYLPGYEEKSIALPNGSEPRNPELLRSGSLDGIEYHFVASLLVGANPSPAPCDPSFDPMRMPRVQVMDPSRDSEGCGFYSWLLYFQENPERRYRSDGNPGVVTIPRHMADRIDMEKLGDKELRTY